MGGQKYKRRDWRQAQSPALAFASLLLERCTRLRLGTRQWIGKFWSHAFPKEGKEGAPTVCAAKQRVWRLIVGWAAGAWRQHAAEVELVEAGENFEAAGVGLAFLDVGEQHGGILRGYFDREVQLLVDPEVGDAALLVGDLPVIASTSADFFDADLLASDIGLTGARMVGIKGPQVLRHGVGSSSGRLANLVFDVHLLFQQKDFGRLGGEVGDEGGLVTGAFHVHPNMAAAGIHLSGNLAQAGIAARGSDLQVGGKGRDLGKLGDGKLKQKQRCDGG